MATSDKAAWQAMQSFLQAMGGVSSAVIGEPKNSVQSGTVAIIPDGGHIVETTLLSPREIHLVTLRHYIPFLEEPLETIDLRLDDWRAQILEDIFGDFDLGGAVAYAWPTECSWEYGYQEIDRVNFRLLDVSIAYYVDDNATFSA